MYSRIYPVFFAFGEILSFNYMYLVPIEGISYIDFYITCIYFAILYKTLFLLDCLPLLLIGITGYILRLLAMRTEGLVSRKKRGFSCTRFHIT